MNNTAVAYFYQKQLLTLQVSLQYKLIKSLLAIKKSHLTKHPGWQKCNLKVVFSI